VFADSPEQAGAKAYLSALMQSRLLGNEKLAARMIPDFGVGCRYGLLFLSQTSLDADFILSDVQPLVLDISRLSKKRMPVSSSIPLPESLRMESSLRQVKLSSLILSYVQPVSMCPSVPVFPLSGAMI